MSYNKKCILVFLLGLFICLTPSFSNFIYKEQSRALLENYYDAIGPKLNQTIKIEDGKTLKETSFSEQLFNEFKNYNEMIYEKGQQQLLDPFSFEVASFNLPQYGFEENIVGDIYIEKLGLDLPIYLGATKENMKKGAVLLGCTSIPIGGENTNAVIAAHRGMGTKEMFRNIEKLEIGDEIIITNFWRELHYKIIEFRVIYPDEVENIFIQEGKDLITLSTCHPYRFNYQRYIVIAERVF